MLAGLAARWPTFATENTACRLKLAHERAYERATPAVRLPIDVESWAAIGIGQGNCRHGVRELRERRIESHFVTAEMIFVIDGAG